MKYRVTRMTEMSEAELLIEELQRNRGFFDVILINGNTVAVKVKSQFQSNIRHVGLDCDLYNHVMGRNWEYKFKISLPERVKIAMFQQVLFTTI